MARPAKGSVRWNATAKNWEVRVTLANGRRSRPIAMTNMPPCAVTPSSPMSGCPCAPCKLADETGRDVSHRIRAGAAVDAATSETVSEWMDRWFADREARGLTSVRDDRSHFKHHVADLLGMTPMANVTRADLETLVEDLDRKAHLPPHHAEALSWKTALNVWATISKAFDDAANAKSRALRVRDDNPAKDVRSPDRGIDRAKQFLYPSEFLTFVECPRIPLKWRRAVALAIYLFPRDGEQRALTWDDVDLDHGTVHIHKAWDRRARELKSTKTKGTRRFAAERNVLPLLAVMHTETEAERTKTKSAGGVEDEPPRAVVEMPSERDMSRGLKRWLRKAGVKRRELFEDSPTTKSITWHDLRATGLTWMAVRGDEPLKIMQRAGHERFETTQRYIREAEGLREGFGDVFPPLPAGLLRPNEFRSDSGESDRYSFSNPAFRGGSWRGGRDSNPGEEAPAASHEPSRSAVKTEANAIGDATSQATVSGADATPEPVRVTDPDEAIRVAAKLAIDAGDVKRAMALLAMLDVATPGDAGRGNVLALRGRR